MMPLATRSMLTRLGLAVIWLLHFLPLALLAPLGRGLGLAALRARAGAPPGSAH